MTRGELRTLVLANLGPVRGLDANINTALNLGLKRIGMREELSHLKTTVESLSSTAAARFITLPTNTQHVVELRLIDGLMSYSIPMQTREWILERYPNPEAEPAGKPMYFYQDGLKAYFERKVDAVYPFWATVSQLPATLLSDSSTTSPADYVDECLISFATALIFRSRQQYQDAAIHEANFERSWHDVARHVRRFHGIIYPSVPNEVRQPPYNPNDPFYGREDNNGIG